MVDILPQVFVFGFLIVYVALLVGLVWWAWHSQIGLWEEITKRLMEALLLALLIPGFGFGQAAQNNWDNLKELRPGQKIEVVDSKMKTFKGTFVSVSDEAISLQVGKSEETVARANVVRVSVHDTSHRTRNMLLASGVIGGIVLIPATIGLAVNGNEGNSCPLASQQLRPGSVGELP
jgi:hypothetical protein